MARMYELLLKVLGLAGQSSDRSNDDLKLPLHGVSCENNSGSDHDLSSWGWWLGGLIGDAVASIFFWNVILFVDVPDFALVMLGAAMLFWRIYRLRTAPESSAALPYSCGSVAANGKELFLVATVHISPRAPRDVEAVINGVSPDIAMIELDEERLDRMRAPAEAPRLQPADLQPLKIRLSSSEPEVTVLSQRALWNAEQSRDLISGEVFHDAENEHGIRPLGPAACGKVALVLRGAPGSEFSPFAMKAHHAFRGGAKAVLVINHEGDLPVQRLGSGPLESELRIFWHTWNCGFPQVPVVLLPSQEGLQLLDKCREQNTQDRPCVEFQVLEDSYPRRTLRRRLCQACALLFSGIGILYGIIQFAGVEVGGEFSAAEAAATSRGIPCVCIDVDMNRFWGRLAAALAPTPRNLWSSATSWLAFPRLMLRCLFPPPGNVDVLGSTVLHAASFPLRTWLAFPLAGFLSSLVMTRVLEALGSVSEHGAEDLGAVRKQDRDQVQAFMMLAIELYMYPQIYDAVVASRDEAMYQSIVARSNEKQAKRLVVVVGAGHSNGILERVRTRGL